MKTSAHLKICKNAARSVITVTSVAVIAALGVLNYYAHRSVGVNHYVHYFKVAYQQGVLNPRALETLGVVALGVALCCIAWLVRLARRRRLAYVWGILAGIEALVCGIVLMLIAFTSLFADLYVWLYAILVLVVLEACAVVLTLLSSRDARAQ